MDECSVSVQYRKTKRQISLSSSRDDIRGIISRELGLDFRRMKILHKGKILKSNQELATHALKGNVLYVVGSARATHLDNSKVTLVQRVGNIWT